MLLQFYQCYLCLNAYFCYSTTSSNIAIYFCTATRVYYNYQCSTPVCYQCSALQPPVNRTAQECSARVKCRVARPSRGNDRDLLNLHPCPIYTRVHRFEPNLYIQIPMLYHPISSPRLIYRTFDLCIQRQIYISDPIYISSAGFTYSTLDLHMARY